MVYDKEEVSASWKPLSIKINKKEGKSATPT
jgi:hypothetical protein